MALRSREDRGDFWSPRKRLHYIQGLTPFQSLRPPPRATTTPDSTRATAPAESRFAGPGIGQLTVMKLQVFRFDSEA